MEKTANIIPIKWFVLFTKPRHELKVLERLISLGIQTYTPTKTVTKQWSDRKKKITIPLLPSMVLVNLENKDPNVVFDVPGVVRYLFEQGKRAVVTNAEVVAMQCYQNNTLQINKNELKIGDTVKVPLLEQEAILLSQKGKNCMAQLKKLGAIVSFQLS
jgi:transcription antitermination factor NusG